MTDDEYTDIRESFELAMHHMGIEPSTIEAALFTVDDAVDNNMESEV